MTRSGRSREDPPKERFTRRLSETGENVSQRVTGGSGRTDRLLNVEEAAAVLGLKPSTLYTWASERRICTVKIGRALRIKLSVVEQLIADCERPALDALRVSGRASEG